MSLPNTFGTEDAVREGLRQIYDALERILTHPDPDKIHLNLFLTVSVIPVNYHSRAHHAPVTIYATALTDFEERDNLLLTRDTARTLSFTVLHPIGTRLFVRPLTLTGFIEAVTDWNIETATGRYKAVLAMAPVLDKLEQLVRA